MSHCWTEHLKTSCDLDNSCNELLRHDENHAHLRQLANLASDSDNPIPSNVLIFGGALKDHQGNNLHMAPPASRL